MLRDPRLFVDNSFIPCVGLTCVGDGLTCVGDGLTCVGDGLTCGGDGLTIEL